MSKVTIVKNYRNTVTLRQMDMSEIVQTIQGEAYGELCRELRRIYPLVEVRQKYDAMDGLFHLYTKDIPRVCFSSQMENRNKQRIMKAYNGLVLLEVNNLAGSEEADAVRKGAAQIPHTLLAFIGASGRSVKIVCRGELFDGGLPENDDDITRFHTNLYEKARVAYNMQLGVTIEKLEPTLDRDCYVSCDSNLFYNPSAQAFYTDCEDVTKAVQPVTLYAEKQDKLMPGIDNSHAMHLIYEYCLSKAYDDTVGISEEEGRTHLILTRLAGYCQESGLAMAVAHEKKYRQRKNITRPMKHIPSETLLMMKVDMFLNANYELRKNVMRGVAEYRMRTGYGFSYQDLTEEARNSITMRALSQGVKCWDKDINRYVNSNDIELYEPMTDFLDHLPKWDGKDRVEPLARRVKTDFEEWPYLFHIWMRSMVAMWRGKGQLTGNALVPILIGRQGCGKTSFCRMLLPRDQREYYNDRINFKNEHDLNLGLTSFALINLDEFDKITQRQQIVLKYLVSTSDLKYRPPYGKAYSQQIVLKYLVSTSDLKYRPPYGKAYSSHRRYASFIGTTNESMPLTDPSGSRRFICVTVEGDIDFETPVDYPQLYAQLEYEVSQQRLRYHLTRDEEHALMEHNLRYQKLSQLGEQLLSLYEKPEGTPASNPDSGKWLSLKEISAHLKKVFKGAYAEDEGSYIKIGNFLSRPEYKFESDRKSFGMVYWVKER